MSAPPSPDPKRWPALLLLAAAICPPLATWLASLEGITIHGLTDNPWVAFILFVLYEVVLAVISIGTKVWSAPKEHGLISSAREWIISLAVSSLAMIVAIASISPISTLTFTLKDLGHNGP